MRTTRHNGEAIRTIREIRGLTGTALARRVGVTSQTLSKIELERKSTSLVTLNRIAAALSIGVGAILRDPTPSSPAPAEHSEQVA